MRKILIILGVFFCITGQSQTIKDWFYARDYYSLKGNQVSYFYEDTLVNPTKVAQMIEDSLASSVSSVDSFFVVGKNVWIFNGDTIDTVNVANYALFALNATKDSVAVTYTATQKMITDSLEASIIVSDTVKIGSSGFLINRQYAVIGDSVTSDPLSEGAPYNAHLFKFGDGFGDTKGYTYEYRSSTHRGTGYLLPNRENRNIINLSSGNISQLDIQENEIYLSASNTDEIARLNLYAGDEIQLYMLNNGVSTNVPVLRIDTLLFKINFDTDTVFKVTRDTIFITNILKADTITADSISTNKLNVNNSISAESAVIDSMNIDKLNSENVYTDTLTLNGATITDTIDLKSAVEAENFAEINFDTATKAYTEGRLHYSPSTYALTFYNNISNFTHQLGYEHVVRFYNNTGGTLTEGTIIRSTGVHINSDINFTAGLAGIGSLDSLNGIAMVTADVLDGQHGIATLIGPVNGLNTSAFSDNQVIYASNAGTYTAIRPEAPEYAQIVGRILYADADSGAIYFYGFSESKYDPSPAYSASFSDSAVTVTNPGINTYALITNASDSLFGERVNYGFVRQGDSIRPLQNGLYDVGISYSAYASAVQTDVYNAGVFVNGILQHKQTRSFSQNSYGGVPFEIPITLTSSDWVSFRIENTNDGTRSAIFVDGVISLEYITTE